MRRIESNGVPRGGREVLVDGRSWPGTCTIEFNTGTVLKVAMWLDGEPVYNAAYYDFDGSLVGVIPPHEAWVREAYDALESPSH